ncbi:ataxin-10 isoform X2 [Ceratina calcarata]|uniref:Ataxin-10 isoform X2 n=1 Tax=Ceratina calcarata TaxID=156304 RepID=A0AAJ7N8Y1_9HYME|nr:ataxin-10 isoform X2 [Ceratina calcarata]
MSDKHKNLVPQLESAYAQGNWNELSILLDPKLFKTLESGELFAFPILGKVSEILTTENPNVPDEIKIACLKCLGNSCFNGYIHKEYDSNVIEKGIYCHKLYSTLTNNEKLEELEYPVDTHFPYEGIIEWAVNLIKSYKTDIDVSHEKLKILRLSIQFLCNLFTFAYKDDKYPDQQKAPQCLYDGDLKDVIMNLTQSEHVPLVKASCIFIHNALKEFEGECFTATEEKLLCSLLLKPINEGFESAKEALMFLLCRPNVLPTAYDDMTIANRLCLLNILHEEVSSSGEYLSPRNTVEFLIERFCARSDLILKTVDMIDEVETREIVILLDIIGTLTLGSCDRYNFLKGYKNLLINCIYLLKSIQMIGKQSDNYFTPLQKLSDVAVVMQEARNESAEGNGVGKEMKSDIQSHPVFGFKAGLIRVIGNLSYKNEECQNLGGRSGYGRRGRLRSHPRPG